jgi:hypothetical protein
MYMQKEDSLSFPMVLGSGVRGLSLLNSLSAKSVLAGEKLIATYSISI